MDFLEIHYIANEGVLLQFRDQHVLIDALFSDGLGEYESPDTEKLRLLRKAAAPYDRVQIVLVTHAHADHFDPDITLDYLKANSAAQLIAPTQVVAKLRELASDSNLDQRLSGFTFSAGERQLQTAAGIELEILGLPHGGPQRDIVENLGYVITLGGQRILHVGDAAIEASSYQPLGLGTRGIDIFLAPFWFLSGQKEAAFVRQWIRPRRQIGIHTQIDDPAQIQQQITAQFQGALMFSNQLGKNIYLTTILE